MKNLFLILIVCITFLKSNAQVDTISIKKHNLNTAFIKEGTNQYLSWIKNKTSGLISNISIWERQISLQSVKGKNVIVVTQHRYYNDSSRNKYVYTISDRNTLKTIYDFTKRPATGIEAFNYNDNEIKGDDTIPLNTKAGFNLKFSDIPYCFELDIETLSALPIKGKGQKIAINFYHPGGTVPPKYYPVDVVGEEVLTLINGQKAACWIIKLLYDNGNYDLSWITKSSHEYLKLESHNPSGTFNKVKLFNSDIKRFGS